jgi:hypothetical protein
MNTAALTLKRSFSPGFVSVFCEQLYALFGGHAKACTAVIAHALEASTMERSLSLEDDSVRSSAHVAFRSQDIQTHFDGFRMGAPPSSMQRALPCIITSAILNKTLDETCPTHFYHSLADVLLGFPIPYTLSWRGSLRFVVQFHPAAATLPMLTASAFEKLHEGVLSVNDASLTDRLKAMLRAQGTIREKAFEDLLQEAMFVRLCIHQQSCGIASSLHTERVIPFTAALGLGSEPWVVRPRVIMGEGAKTAGSLMAAENQGAIMREIPEQKPFGLCLPQPTIEWLFHLKALNTIKSITFAQLRAEINKAPPPPTKRGYRRVMVVLASSYCATVQTSFEGADLLPITSGRYSVSESCITCATGAVTSTRCPLASLSGDALL